MTGLKIEIRNGMVAGNQATKAFTLPTGVTAVSLSFKVRITATPGPGSVEFMWLAHQGSPYGPILAELKMASGGILSVTHYGYPSPSISTQLNLNTIHDVRVQWTDSNENGEFDTMALYLDEQFIGSETLSYAFPPTSLTVGPYWASGTTPGDYDLHIDDILINYEGGTTATVYSFGQDVDLSEWDSKTENGSSTIVSHADAGMNGTAQGLKTTITSTNHAYVKKDFTAFSGIQSEIELYLNKQGLTWSSGDEFGIAVLRSAANNVIGRIRINRNGTDHRLMAQFHDDSASMVDTADHLINAAQDHKIKAVLKRAASDVSADGSIELWVNDSLVETVPNLDIYDAPQWAHIRAGAVDLLDAGTSGILLMDEISVTDVSEGQSPEISFSGAEGYGAKTIIASPVDYYVTDPADTNTPGTLRYGIETVTGDTLIKTATLSQWISLNNALRIERPGVHIDFSGAPGKGLGVRDHTFEIRESAIVRYMRFGCGPSHPNPDSADALSIRLDPTRTSDLDGVIVDHCQLLFAIDGSLDISNGRAEQSLGPEILKNITIQNCIIAYHLEDAGHPDGNHSRPILITEGVDRVSLLHNLIAFSHTRNPFVKRGGSYEIVGNVVHAVREGMRLGQKNNSDIITANVISNVFRNGGVSLNTLPILINVEHTDPLTQADHDIYLANNATMDALGDLTIPANQRTAMTSGEWGQSGSPADERFFAATERPWSDVKPTIRTPQAVYDYVLANAGVTLPGSDSLRDAIIAHVQAGTGNIIDDPSEVGGYPDLS